MGYVNVARVQVISCQKYGVAKHVGVLFLPEGLVAHCSPKRGVAVTTVADFLDGAPGYKVERHIAAEQRSACLSRLQWAQENRPAYDLFTWNCEHFVAYISGQTIESPQLSGAVAFGAGAAVLTAVILTLGQGDA